MKAKVLRTVGEVRDALCMVPSDTPIYAAWEGCHRQDIRVYRGTDGVMYIDADEGHDQLDLQDMKCECGKRAKVFQGNSVMCMSCFTTFIDEGGEYDDDCE